jgi:hypothetical protein
MSSARHRTLWTIALICVATSACLDPLTSDDVGLQGLVLPAGSEVPDAHDDPAVDQQIADNDGVEGVVPRISAFAKGQRVHYWDFGATPDFAAPIYVLIERDDQGEVTMLPHNTIVETIPGDAGYSPYWSLFFLEVTDDYQGELITSFAAIEEAQALGLVKAAELSGLAVNCPAVATNVEIEVGGGRGSLAPQSRFFWQGKTVRYYDFGFMPVSAGTRAAIANLYMLTREGLEPLSEPVRGVDITGDGDTNDSNNVFALSKSDEEYTPLCQVMNVTVPAEEPPPVGMGLNLIDTSDDETMSDITSSTDLFNPDPVPGTVISFEQTSFLGNCPQQSAPGGL